LLAGFFQPEEHLEESDGKTGSIEPEIKAPDFRIYGINIVYEGSGHGADHQAAEATAIEIKKQRDRQDDEGEKRKDIGVQGYSFFHGSNPYPQF
jgi:hypothetical protein